MISICSTATLIFRFALLANVHVLPCFLPRCAVPPQPENISCSPMLPLSVNIPPLSQSKESYVISDYVISLKGLSQRFSDETFRNSVAFNYTGVSSSFNVTAGVTYAVEVLSRTGDASSKPLTTNCTARKLCSAVCLLVFVCRFCSCYLL
jgi:hypothetical protein